MVFGSLFFYNCGVFWFYITHGNVQTVFSFPHMPFVFTAPWFIRTFPESCMGKNRVWFWTSLWGVWIFQQFHHATLQHFQKILVDWKPKFPASFGSLCCNPRQKKGALCWIRNFHAIRFQGPSIPCPTCCATMLPLGRPTWGCRGPAMKHEWCNMVMRKPTVQKKSGTTSRPLWMNLVCQQWNQPAKKGKSLWKKVCLEFMQRFADPVGLNGSFSPSTVAWVMCLVSTQDSLQKFHPIGPC